MPYITAFDGNTDPSIINTTTSLNGCTHLYCTTSHPYDLRIDAFLQIVTPYGNRLIPTEKAYISTEEVFKIPEFISGIFDQNIYLAFTPSSIRQLTIYAHRSLTAFPGNPNLMSTEQNLTISDTVQQILTGNPNRINYNLVNCELTDNPSDHIIWIAKSPNNLGEGFPLLPNGSSASLAPDLYYGPLYAIAPTATKIYIEEISI